MEKLKRQVKKLELSVRNVTKRPRKVSTETSTFLADPLESVMVHIGNYLDRASTEEIVNLALYGGLAFASLEANEWQDPRAALVGPIGLKLATTMGGTPPVSQIAGLAILAALGYATIAPGEAYQTIDVGGIPIKIPLKPKFNWRVYVP